MSNAHDEGFDVLLHAATILNEQGDTMMLGRNGALQCYVIHTGACGEQTFLYNVPDLAQFGQEHQTMLNRKKSLNGAMAALTVLNEKYRITNLVLPQSDD